MRSGWNKFYRALHSHKIVAVAAALILIVAGYVLISSNASDIWSTARTEAVGSTGNGANPHASGVAASGIPSAQATPSTSASAKPSASASPTMKPTSPAPKPPKGIPEPGKDWPNSKNTGYPVGTTLKTCSTSITKAGTYDKCKFNGDVVVKASNVKITNSLINGAVNAGSGSQQSGLVISDTTINCGCLADNSHTPAAIQESNYTLLRVNLYNSGHGAAVKSNVVIQDSYIHGLGANTDAHKDGIYSGDGTNVLIRHNTIECNDGSHAGCTSAIGLLTDFGDISYWTIDHNLLNTVGSYCFYGSGGPQKRYSTHHITFTNNHFGQTIYPKCGFYGPVTYFDMKKAGMVWSGNVWDDTGATVAASY